MTTKSQTSMSLTILRRHRVSRRAILLPHSDDTELAVFYSWACDSLQGMLRTRRKAGNRRKPVKNPISPTLKPVESAICNSQSTLSSDMHQFAHWLSKSPKLLVKAHMLGIH